MRRRVADVPDGALVLVACSGGPDSLGLAAALAFVAVQRGRRRLRAGAVVIDHGLQDGSDRHSRAVADRLAGLGLDPVRVVRVRVEGPGGPEAAARRARYAALDASADETGAVAVLLGHTRDDQAETVLLGLARGSGGRSLAGMAAVTGRYRRPLLGVARATLRAACAAQLLEPWDDPHNEDRAFARVRLRRDALPALEAAVGTPDGAVTAALARSAATLREDCDALDLLAEEAFRALGVDEAAASFDIATDALAPLLPAIRSRVLRRLALAAGSAAGDLTARHVAVMGDLVCDWHGQGEAALPTGVRASRRCGRLVVTGDRPSASPV